MKLNPEIKMRWVVLLFLVGGMLVWYFAFREESESGQRARWRKEATISFYNQTTNTVGWRRTLRTNTYFYEQHYAKWRASAEVEFINPAGGVQVTNLHFKVVVNSNGEKNCARCDIDYSADSTSYYFNPIK